MSRTIVLLGAGAIGSMLADNLTSDDISFVVFDDGVVDTDNLSLSAYWNEHVGQFKVDALSDLLQKKHGLNKCTPVVMRVLDVQSVLDIVEEPDLIVDCFDNVESRSIFTKIGKEVVHVGVSAERHGEVIWDEVMEYPENPPAREEEVICTRAAGRPILRMTSTIAARIIEKFLENGTKENVLVTEDRVV